MNEFIKGRGAQHNPKNPYLSTYFAAEEIEGIYEHWKDKHFPTHYIEEHPATILSKNDSPDIPFTYSINPYQGCEHGCIYCYARNAHHYWGYGAGLDFEQKIVVKPNAARLLEAKFLSRSWKPETVVLSGNTDCYQPAERKWKITRSLLSVFEKYRNPVRIITKNALVLRDLDLLTSLQADNLVKVFITITTLDENLRRRLEPRASSFHKRLKIIQKLSSRDIPCGVMIGPVIPGLTEHEMPKILERAAESGASTASYTVLRLNGAIGDLFDQWLDIHYPGQKQKILNKVRDMHNGKVNDTEWGRRMRGDGQYALIIRKLFDTAFQKFFKDKPQIILNLNAFRKGGNYNLFD